MKRFPDIMGAMVSINFILKIVLGCSLKFMNVSIIVVDQFPNLSSIISFRSSNDDRSPFTKDLTAVWSRYKTVSTS